ncbi:MAG: ACT domain-containing protein [Chromatiales bacterium]
MKYTVKQQLVIATETGSGVLTEICALLNKQRINIQDIYATEEKSKGMLYLIVDDTDAAEKVMRKAGFIPLVINVLLIDSKDSPGTLGRICSLFAHHGINIEYVYGSENVHHHLMTLIRRMVIVMKVSDIDKAVNVLEKKGAAISALFSKDKKKQKGRSEE